MSIALIILGSALLLVPVLEKRFRQQSQASNQATENVKPNEVVVAPSEPEPPLYAVTEIDGKNIHQWELEARDAKASIQILRTQLNTYAETIERMDGELKELRAKPTESIDPATVDAAILDLLINVVQDYKYPEPQIRGTDAHKDNVQQSIYKADDYLREVGLAKDLSN